MDHGVADRLAAQTVTLYRDFAEDRRRSMDIYADGLAAGLAQCPGAPRVCQFIPTLGHAAGAAGPSRMQLRWARYARYPALIAPQRPGLHHIIDHGYGHLLWRLDPARTVVTVHDLIPLARWKGRMPGVARGRFPLLNVLSLRALRRAARLIAVSQSTARDLVDLAACDPQRIRVIPNGLSGQYAVQPDGDRDRWRRQLGLPAAVPLVLISGGAFYKNHAACLAVLARLREQPLALVRLGPPDAQWDAAVAAAGLQSRVHALPSVEDAQLPLLYRSVDCLLFPSHYEGFGWPVLEAMACGLAVVCSNAASLPEVAGDAALTAAPDDIEGLADAVRRVLADAPLRDRLTTAGRAHAARFSWAAHARGVVGVYGELLDPRGSP